MKEFSVSAELSISAHAFFLERDSVAFRCLLGQALDLGSLEFDQETVEGKVVKVWQTTYPRFDKYVPSGVAKMAQKLIGNKLVYTDILSYDLQKLREPPFEIGVISIAPVFKDKTTLRSRLIIESLGPKRCRQTLQGSIDVRVAGLGKTVEKIIVQQLTKVYQSIPAVIDRWLQFRKLAAEQQACKWLLLGRPDTRLDWVLQQYTAYQKGILSCAVPDCDNKENLGTGELLQQVMQKAQAQLQLEKGGLKSLPTQLQVESSSLSSLAPQISHQAAGSVSAAPVTMQQATSNSTVHDVPGDVSAVSFRKPSTALNRESSLSFGFLDTATSVELANAEEPTPWLQDQQPQHDASAALGPVPEHRPSIAVMPVRPDAPGSYASSAPNGHVDALHGPAVEQPAKRQKRLKFWQCIPCGAAPAS